MLLENSLAHNPDMHIPTRSATQLTRTLGFLMCPASLFLVVVLRTAELSVKLSSQHVITWLVQRAWQALGGPRLTYPF